MITRSVAVVAFTLVACSSPARPQQHPRTEIVSIVNGMIVRTHGDGSVGVIVEVKRGEVSAPGAIRLHGIDAAAALTSPHLRFARGRAWQAIAETPAVAPQIAYESALAGLEDVGVVLLPNVADEGNMRVVQAKDLVAREPARISEAVEILRRALKTRLRLYARRWSNAVD